jgi:hypothetical protein
MRRIKTGLSLALLAGSITLWSACGDSNEAGDDAGSGVDSGFSTHFPDGAPVPDGTVLLPDGNLVQPDGAPLPDTGPSIDGTTPDSAPLDDGAIPDSGHDATVVVDAGQDSGLKDSGAIPDTGTVVTDAGASVVMHHNHPSRDGMYVEPTFTKAAVATLHVDTTFKADVDGPVLAQPLFVEAGPKGKDVIIVASEKNVVYAFDAAGGAVVWKTPALGTPVPVQSLINDVGCGDIDPLGITGTPFVDLATRTIFLDAMVTPDGSAKKHLIYALSLDDGGVRSGWPIDVEAALAGAPTKFVAKVQNQRGALALINGVLYVPYGGHSGDCGGYHGWLVSVPISNPAGIKAFATKGTQGGIWGSAGPSYDGTSIFATTGNTSISTAPNWGHGDAVLRFTSGAVFSGNTADYYAPSNWPTLDQGDMDLGGAAAVPINLAGSTPSQLILALGKDLNAYLLDRNNLGGIGAEVAKVKVGADQFNPTRGAAAIYKTATAQYAAFRGGKGAACTNGGAGNLVAITLKPGAPPTIVSSWCSAASYYGSPIVTTTDGTSNAIVWATQNDSLMGLDGDTGAVVWNGSAQSNQVPGANQYNTPIVAKGRIYVVGSIYVPNFLRAFKL